MAYVKKTDQKKPWALRTSNVKRVSREFEVRNIFLIYCEGENTEPEYFKSFPINTETKVTAIGLGRSKTVLVEKVIAELDKKQYLEGQSDYDPDRRIWCVFDFDTTNREGEDSDYDHAINLAESNNINAACSNDSFELWFLLHYQYTDSQLTRAEYYQRLSSIFGWNYEEEGKKKDIARSFYGILLEHQNSALKNAERLHSTMSKFDPHDQNPCTRVDKLVLELNKCLKR